MSIQLLYGRAPEVDKINPRSLDQMTLLPWLQRSTKSIPEVSIWRLSSLGSRSRQNLTQKSRFDDFLVLAPEVDKTIPRSIDLMTFWPWLQKLTKSFPEVSIWWSSSIWLQNSTHIQNFRFHDPWPWLQRSTKSIPEVSIWRLSGLGSRSGQTHPQKSRFDDCLALAPEVVKISTRNLH